MEHTDRLHRACSELGIKPTDLQLEKICRWIELLQKWNTAYNLTALNDTDQIIRHLVIGSIVAIPYMRGSTVLDVGSGSGVPGIPLAIFAPRYQYTLIDGNGKKTRFLEHCRIFLELTNVEIKQTRAESFKPSAKFDTIISRALTSLDQFITTTLHLGHKQTRWLTFKGKISRQELRKLEDIETNLSMRHSLQKLNAEEELQNLIVVRY